MYQCFVIMPFEERFDPVATAVKQAAEGKVRAVRRGDDVVDPGHIIAQIEREIRRSDFCIADLTDVNPNVMWEVGFATALGKRVIAIRQGNAELPFDVAGVRCFEYDLRDLERLAVTLRESVERVVSVLAADPAPLAWRHDEMRVLRDKLSQKAPIQGGRSLLELLRTALRPRAQDKPWGRRDSSRLMRAIDDATDSRREYEDSFWWLIVFGVLEYDQIQTFQVGESNGVSTNLELVELSERGVALLEWLRESSAP